MSVRAMLASTATAALLAMGSIAGASTAQAAPPADDPTEPGPRLTRACERVPRQLARVQKAQTRINGDVHTKGSIAFLQARIDRATAEGHTDAARLLTDRLAVRKDVAATLPDMLVRLEDAQEVCDSRGASTSGSAGS